MLYLNAKDIENLLCENQAIDLIESAFLQSELQEHIMPDRVNVYDGENIFAYMPCFMREAKGTKVLTMFPANRVLGLPPVQGVMLLNNAENGKIECILDGAALTANRTGAVGSVGIKYLSGPHCGALGIIGAGAQGFTQCLYASKIRNIHTISVLDVDGARAKAFADTLQTRLPAVNINVCHDAEALLKRSEIVITTTTSHEPILPDNRELLQGKHFIGIGSYKPRMREYPQALFGLLDTIYIDVEYAKEETGDIITPLQQGWFQEERIKRLGQAIHEGGICAGSTTFLKSVGMALFDLCLARYLYLEAVKRGVGQIMAE